MRHESSSQPFAEPLYVQCPWRRMSDPRGLSDARQLSIIRQTYITAPVVCAALSLSVHGMIVNMHMYMKMSIRPRASGEISRGGRRNGEIIAFAGSGVDEPLEELMHLHDEASLVADRLAPALVAHQVGCVLVRQRRLQLL